MNSPVLLVERLNDTTALLTLNRPERRNALTIELMTALCAALDALASEPERRVAIVCGAGAGFCSGLDLNETADPDIAEHSADWVARTFKTLSHSPLVTIAADQARAMGLVHRVVPRDRLLDESRSLAATILKGAPDAVRQTKRWLHELRSTEPSQWLMQALKVHKRAREGDEASEGLAAFLEHREPDWPTTSSP